MSRRAGDAADGAGARAGSLSVPRKSAALGRRAAAGCSAAAAAGGLRLEMDPWAPLSVPTPARAGETAEGAAVAVARPAALTGAGAGACPPRLPRKDAAVLGRDASAGAGAGAGAVARAGEREEAVVGLAAVAVAVVGLLAAVAVAMVGLLAAVADAVAVGREAEVTVVPVVRAGLATAATAGRPTAEAGAGAGDLELRN